MRRFGLKRVQGAALCFGLLAAGLGTNQAVAASALCAAPASHRYAGAVSHYIADLKTSFPEHTSYSAATALTEANYRTVLAGLSRNVGVDGIRLPIVVAYASAGNYPELYKDIFAYARSIGLLIYASPLAVGKSPFAGWSDDRYATWLAAYAAAFRPDALSPFNEANMDEARMTSIVTKLRAKLNLSLLLVGPDRQFVVGTLRDVDEHSGLASLFDIVASHNSDRDITATAGNWSHLVAAVPSGKPVWSSENPAGWAAGQIQGLPGLDQAVAGGVQGLVIWKAKPGLVDDAGQATAKACEIATHLIGGL